MQKHLFRRASMALWAALAVVGVASCGNSDKGTESGAPAAGSQTAQAAPPNRTPKRVEGSAAALSHDGQRVYVADEDHEAVFIAPVSFDDTSSARVVAMPGPPAQVVAAGDVVLVTVRTLPAEEAKAARAEIRGPLPEAGKIHRFAAARLNELGLYYKEDELKKFKEEHAAPPVIAPAGSAAASASASAAPGASGAAAASGTAAASGSPSAKPTASAKAAPPVKPPTDLSKVMPPPTSVTPSRPIDPNVVRKSQGGLLLAMKPDAERGLVEVGRVLLPPDAWGLAVTPDGNRAVVTSAWAGQVSVVDLAAMKVVVSLPVAREPRGVTITKDGKTAYVSHLIGSDLTRIDELDGTPKTAAQPLPSAPSRTPDKTTVTASLGYALVLSPDEQSLYAPRHAIGAEGRDAWWGATTVDILDRKTGKPVAPSRRPGSPANVLNAERFMPPHSWMAGPGRLPAVESALVQPRAVVYRKKTGSLLVAGEGSDMLVELDASAPDPSMFARSFMHLAAYAYSHGHAYLGGAPSAIALSEDEETAYVYCRTTFDLVKVDLKTRVADWLRLADDNLPEDASIGRRLYTNSRYYVLSGGMGCASCHPDGRDDGYVWREAIVDSDKEDSPAAFVGLRSNMKEPSTIEVTDEQGRTYNAMRSPGDPAAPHKFYPRQTPMLAGRARAAGPYGWHAEADDIVARLARGFLLHREPWQTSRYVPDEKPERSKLRIIDALADFIQSGLMPPPVVEHPLTEAEKRGKELFENDQVQCARCHVPATEFADRTAYPLRSLPLRAGFDVEKNSSFKTPSLYFIAGTAPYFHDGSQATLEDLIKNNGSRMGNTEKLSAEDQAALVAYLKTL